MIFIKTISMCVITNLIKNNKEILIAMFIMIFSFNTYAKSNIYTCEPLPYDDIRYYVFHPLMKTYLNDGTLESITSFIRDESLIIYLRYSEEETTTFIQFFDESGDGNLYKATDIIETNGFKAVLFNTFVLSWYDNKIMLLWINNKKITPFSCIMGRSLKRGNYENKGEIKMKKPFNSRSSIKKEEHNNDTFITPKNAIIPLIDILGIQDGDRIYDCCCGHGDNHHRIGKVIAKYKNITYDGFDLVQDDIEVYPRKFNSKLNHPSIRNNKEPSDNLDDIYNKLYDELDWLISNPPYGRHSEGVILKHLFMALYLDVMSVKGVALLLPITTLAGKSYAELYRRHGYPSLLLFTSRVQFIDQKQSNVDVAWFIWKRGEEPFMKHVDLVK